MNLHDWQQTLNGRLINDFLFELRFHGICECRQLTHQLLVISAAVELDNKVSALGSQTGGVRRSFQQHADTVWIILLALILNKYVTNQSTDPVSFIEIGVDIYITCKTYNQRLRYKSHLIEVGFSQIGRDGTFDFLRT